MTIKYNDTLTLETIGEPVLDNYKDHAAYYWTAYNPAAKFDWGNHPAYRLIYIADGVTNPENEIDWMAPDDIQEVGGYDPETSHIG